MQWEVKKEAAVSRIVEQRMNKEAVEAENAANNAKLAEHLVHVGSLCWQPAMSPCNCPPPRSVPVPWKAGLQIHIFESTRGFMWAAASPSAGLYRQTESCTGAQKQGPHTVDAAV